MSSQDFIRQSGGLGTKSRYSKSIWRTIHIDPPLLVGITLLCGFGLLVLFSASGGDVPVVQRQALTMVVGLVVMFIVAQFNVHFFQTVGADTVCGWSGITRAGVGRWSGGKWRKELVRFAWSA